MIRRFKIEDLIVQDASGVIFRAIDSETGSSVALRRFFPFGAAGGGLDVEEQAAYNIAVARLSGLSHPALRAVVCGGCDPVDGIPFIATEWVDGDSLDPIVTEGPLSAEATARLVTSALEVSELLSHVLAEEAVWVETDLRTIIVGEDRGERMFTFWISPLKWLGGGSESRGLQSIVMLTEELMGWTGRIVNDEAGRGLGAWLNWLRGAASTTTLAEARQMLAASIGAEPPDPAKQLAAQATRPLKRSVKKSSFKAPVLAALGLLLAVGGVVGWIMGHQREPVLPKQVSISPSSSVIAEKTSSPPGPRPAASMEPAAAVLDSAAARRAREKAAVPEAPATIAAAPAGVIPWNNHTLLVESDKKPVTVEGVFEAIGYSVSKQTLYMQFSSNPGRNDARGAILLKNVPDELSATALMELIGKKVQLHGVVAVQKSGGLKRPDINITERASIKVVD